MKRKDNDDNPNVLIIDGEPFGPIDFGDIEGPDDFGEPVMPEEPKREAPAKPAKEAGSAKSAKSAKASRAGKSSKPAKESAPAKPAKKKPVKEEPEEEAFELEEPDVSEEEEEGKPESGKQGRIVRVGIGVLIVLVAVAALVLYKTGWLTKWLGGGVDYSLAATETKLPMVNEIDTVTDTVGDLFIRVNRSGALAVNKNASTAWDVAFGMKSPSVVTAGRYVAVADRSGTTAVVLNTSGEVYRMTAEFPIELHAINEQGKLILVCKDNDGYTLYLYSDNGSLLLKRKTYSGKDGIPTAAALSPDGERMAVASLTYTGTELNTVLTVFDLSLSGGQLVDRILGSRVLNGTLVALLHCGNESCLYLGDNQFGSVGIKNGVTDLWSDSLAYQLTAVAFGDEAFAVALGERAAGVAETSAYDFYLYSYEGETLMKQKFGGVTGLRANGNRFVAVVGRTFIAFDARGLSLWHYESAEELLEILPLDDKNLVAARSRSEMIIYKIIESSAK